MTRNYPIINYPIILCLIIAVFCCLVGCGAASRTVPQELDMRYQSFSKDDKDACKKHLQNFERQLPGLYQEGRLDSIIDIIDYIETECGPEANLEITRLLVVIDQERFSDTLIHSSTISQMLGYRRTHERLLRNSKWATIYGELLPPDTAHDNFVQIRSEVAKRVSSNGGLPPSARALGLFYSGAFDSAFGLIQSDELQGTELQKQYDEFTSQAKKRSSVRRHYSIFGGSWRPKGNARILENHKQVGFQMGREGNKLRADLIVSYRFSPAESEYSTGGFGQKFKAGSFNSFMLGVEAGYKFFDSEIFSTDVFVGLGYDEIFNINRPDGFGKFGAGGLLGTSVGLRQRAFLNPRTGSYIGGIIRYNVIDYSNPGGADLSGNTLSFSVVIGWSVAPKLYQLLDKLNFKGDRRR